jgi:hypothetical protein
MSALPVARRHQHNSGVVEFSDVLEVETKNATEVAFFVSTEGCSDRLDLAGLEAFLALGHFELHALVLCQSLESVALDFAEVREQILTALIGGDEAEALGIVEPFHGAGLSAHVSFL